GRRPGPGSAARDGGRRHGPRRRRPVMTVLAGSPAVFPDPTADAHCLAAASYANLIVDNPTKIRGLRVSAHGAVGTRHTAEGVRPSASSRPNAEHDRHHGEEDGMARLSPVLQQATPVLAARGEGAYLFDDDGRRYLDFTSGIGVVATGHCHPRVVEAAQRQVA